MSDMAIDETRARRVIEQITANPGLSNREAARRFGCPESTIRRTKATMEKTPLKTFQITELTLDTATQPRVEMDESTVAEYGEVVASGGTLPPIDVFDDGQGHIVVADGFHRVQGSLMAGRETIEALVHEGDKRAAILWSVGANASHGLRRKVADKVRAVASLLVDPEWTGWPDTKIAEACRVTSAFVGVRRRVMANDGSSNCLNPESTTDRNGPRADKRRAIELMLKSRDTQNWPDAQIAESCEASVPTVAKIRRELGVGKVAKAKPSTNGPASSNGSNTSREPGDDDEPIPGTDGQTVAVAGTPEVSESERFLASIPIRSKLSDRCRATFDRAALRHRKAGDWLKQAKALGLAVEPKTGEQLDPFTSAVIRLVRFAFPHAWLICIKCNGGNTSDGAVCQDCHQCGFVIPSPSNR